MEKFIEKLLSRKFVVNYSLRSKINVSTLYCTKFETLILRWREHYLPISLIILLLQQCVVLLQFYDGAVEKRIPHVVTCDCTKHWAVCMRKFYDRSCIYVWTIIASFSQFLLSKYFCIGVHVHKRGRRAMQQACTKQFPLVKPLLLQPIIASLQPLSAPRVSRSSRLVARQACPCMLAHTYMHER